VPGWLTLSLLANLPAHATRTYLKVISHTVSRWDRTLRFSCRAVHDICTLLRETMPVQSSGLIAQAIVDMHNKSISQIHFDQRTWPFPIDTNYWARETVRRAGDPCYVPVVSDSLGNGWSAECDQKGKKVQHVVGCKEDAGCSAVEKTPKYMQLSHETRYHPSCIFTIPD